MASGGGSRSVLGSSDEAFEFECDYCIQDGKHREAKRFCRECKAYLCGSCKDSHSRFPALRKHKIVSTVNMINVCGFCSTDGKKKAARYFCKNCDGWICDDCKKSHERFRDLQNHTLVSKKDMSKIDATAPSDISMRLSKLSTKPLEASFSIGGSVTKPQHYDGNQLADIRTKPSVVVATKPSTASLISQHNNINFLCYKTIKKIKAIKVKVSGDSTDCYITGCCFMPGGELVLCDRYNAKIKLLDRSLSVVNSLDLPGQPWNIASVDSSNVIVTMPLEKQLQFIQVLPSLKAGRTIYVGVKCWGVAVAADKIFVSCYDYDEKVAEIRVYEVEGRDLGKRHGINSDGSTMFSCHQYVAVSKSGDEIFVSDWNTDTVSCLTSDGKILYQYRDDELKGPHGLFVDDNNNVIVCDWSRHTVQVITSAGKKHKTVLSSDAVISQPACVSLRPNDGTLVVGCFYSNKLFVCKMS